MATDLRSLKRKKAEKAPRILIYGPPGMGKTSLAGEFPNAIFIQTEDGTPGDREIVAYPFKDGVARSYNEVIDAIAELASEEHDFTTVVLDSADKFEPLLWDQVCADNKWETLEDPGYGKGYASTDKYWRYVIDGLNTLRNARNMTVVILAHSTIERFDSPTSQAYNRYDIRLHKRAMAIIQDDVDAILFVNQDATIKTEKSGFNKETSRAEGGGTRWIYGVGRPAFIAKNRYGIPDKQMFREFEGYACIADYLPAQYAQVAEEAPATRKKTKADKAPVPEAVAYDDSYSPPGEAA